MMVPMAQLLTSHDLRALPIESYENVVRPKLRTGDLLFCSGSYWPSRLIQLATKSTWSHVGLVVRLESFDRVLLLESVESAGVRFAPLSKYLHDYKGPKPYAGTVVAARHTGMGSIDHIALTSFGLDQLALPYNTIEILRIMLRIVLNLRMGEAGIPSKKALYICSELVETCMSQVGVTVPRGRKAYVTPADVWNDPAVEMIGRIK